MEENNINKLSLELVNYTSNENKIINTLNSNELVLSSQEEQFNLKFVGLCLWYANMERILITMLFIYLSTNNKKYFEKYETGIILWQINVIYVMWSLRNVYSINKFKN